MTRSLRAAALNPVGVAILGLGFLIVIATATLPALAAYSGRAYLLALLTLVAYRATAALHGWPRRRPPEVLRLVELRAALAEQLSRRRAAERLEQPGPLSLILAESVQRIDDDLIPALEQLVARTARF